MAARVAERSSFFHKRSSSRSGRRGRSLRILCHREPSEGVAGAGFASDALRNLWRNILQTVEGIPGMMVRGQVTKTDADA